MKKISIVLASYNGSKYIREQLDSIRNQTIKPDEVIIADDCSNDGTFELCKEYVSDLGGGGWTVYRNPHNLGVHKNFREALKKATGDYVFTCDQDDVWVSDKIEVMTKTLDENPNIVLLASNYIPIRDGQRIKTHVKNLTRDDGAVIQIQLVKYWLENQRPGCTFCFRRELLERFKVFDIPDALHDSMLWKTAIVLDGLYLINRQLIFYRRHSSNVTGALTSNIMTLQQKIDSSDAVCEFYGKFLNASDVLMIPPKNRAALERKIKFLKRRKKILAGRNLFVIAFFVLLNTKYYPTLRNALSDVYSALKLRNS